MNYEQGLSALKRLAEGTDWFSDFHLYEARLRKNMEQAKLYGTNEAIRTDLAQILDQINQLAHSHLGISFNALCQGAGAIPPVAFQNTGEMVQQASLPAHLSASSSPLHTEAFISYSRKDKRFLDELHMHLEYYVRTGAIRFWDDTKIPPGAKWREEIEKALQAAKVAVLLISADFLASDFIAKNELPPLLAAAEQEGAIILCVILRPCAFKHTNLAQFQAVNAPSDPLSNMSFAKREKIWVQVAELISKSI